MQITDLDLQRETSNISPLSFRVSQFTSISITWIYYLTKHIVICVLGFAVTIVELMEEHLSNCLTKLKASSLPLLSDLMGNEEKVADLKPSTSRLWLCKFKEEISKAKSEHNQEKYGKPRSSHFNVRFLI